MIKKSSSAIALAVAVLVSGCASDITKRTRIAYNDSDSMLNMILRAQNESTPREDKPTMRVKTPYLGIKSVPFKSDLVLPGIFNVPKEFVYPGEKLTLAQAAERISRVSGIPIRIAQDVYTIKGKDVKTIAAGGQNLNGGIDTNSSVVPAIAPMVGGMSGMPAGMGAMPAGANAHRSASGIDVGDSLNNITLDATATPKQILDQLVTLNGLNWEYRDGVAIIQRLLSRSLQLNTTPGETSYDFNVGKNATSEASSAATGTSGSISTGFTSNSSVKRVGKLTPLDSVKEAVKGVLSPYGDVFVSHATGTITVLDTIDGVEHATKLVNRENEILGRNATFRVEIISFKQKDSDQSGVEWDVVYDNMSKFGATITSPTSLVSATGATLGLQILTGPGGKPGRFDGSSAFLKLLNEVGEAHSMQSINVQTRNRNMTPASILAQTVYLARTTPAPASGTGVAGGVPGLEPGTITTGLDLKLQPNIMDNNQISLLMSVGLVDLIDIKTLTSGVGVNQQSIEAPATSGFEFQYDVSLTPGRTAVLSGYERIVNDFTERKLSRNSPLLAGGSFKGQSNKEKIFILVTPVVMSNKI